MNDPIDQTFYLESRGSISVIFLAKIIFSPLVPYLALKYSG